MASCIWTLSITKPVTSREEKEVLGTSELAKPGYMDSLSIAVLSSAFDGQMQCPAPALLATFPLSVLLQMMALEKMSLRVHWQDGRECECAIL